MKNTVKRDDENGVSIFFFVLFFLSLFLSPPTTVAADAAGRL